MSSLSVRSLSRVACLSLMVAAVAACRADLPTGLGDGTEARGVAEASVEGRTFAMGWAATPPRITHESVVATVDEIARVGEYILIQQAPPWTRLLAGEPIDDLVEETGRLADYMKSLGSELVLVVDPLDGLDRRKEPFELVLAGRSIVDPEVRALHEEWVRRLTDRLRPAYLGLASEINTLAAHGDPTLYAHLVDMINGLSAEMRSRHPEVQVFVSFQVDDAWNYLIPGEFDHFALIDDFEIDALGLSSYPGMVFDAPKDIPDDYLARFRRHTDLPLILVEGGWSSAPTQWWSGTPEDQVAFFRRYETLLDGVDARLWVFLIYADFAVSEWGLPPEREATLRNFAAMGVVDTEFLPKPAHAEWLRILDRPLIR